MKRITGKRLGSLLAIAAVVMLSLWFFSLYVNDIPSVDAALNPSAVSIKTSEKEPLLEDVDVKMWARDGAISAYTIRAEDIEQGLKNSSNYFTKKGWIDFFEALRQTQNLDRMRESQISVTAKALESPRIIERGVADNAYFWRIQLPIEVTWHTKSRKSTQKLMINMKIRRVNKQINPKGPGIGIEQFFATPLSNAAN